MISFHVSSNVYSPGTVVSTNNYIEITKKRGNEWVERLLQKYKPEHALSRLACVFTFQDLEQALAYGVSLRYPVHYYKVEIADNPLSCPMVLCNTILKSKGRNRAIMTHLCQEYWNPSKDWKFKELLSDNFIVIENLNITDFSPKFIGKARHDGDTIKAEYLLKEWKTITQEK